MTICSSYTTWLGMCRLRSRREERERDSRLYAVFNTNERNDMAYLTKWKGELSTSAKKAQKKGFSTQTKICRSFFFVLSIYFFSGWITQKGCFCFGLHCCSHFQIIKCTLPSYHLSQNVEEDQEPKDKKFRGEILWSRPIHCCCSAHERRDGKEKSWIGSCVIAA